MDFKKFQKEFTSHVTQDTLMSDVELILSPGGELQLDEAIEVYKIDYQTRMKEALGVNFEATWAILGDDQFDELAQAYIKKYASKNANLTNYGHLFPEFILEQKCEDYVYEMALFERCYWEYFHASDRTPLELNENILSQYNFNLENVTLIKSSLNLDLVWRNRELGLGGLSEEDLFCDSYFAIFRSIDHVQVISLSHLLIYELLEELKIIKKISNLNNRFATLSTSDWAIVMRVLKYN